MQSFNHLTWIDSSEHTGTIEADMCRGLMQSLNVLKDFDCFELRSIIEGTVRDTIDAIVYHLTWIDSSEHIGTIEADMCRVLMQSLNVM
jgi:hypothetical protein